MKRSALSASGDARSASAPSITPGQCSTSSIGGTVDDRRDEERRVAGVRPAGLEGCDLAPRESALGEFVDEVRGEVWDFVAEAYERFALGGIFRSGL